MSNKTAVQVPIKEISKILEAYHTLDDFLKHYIEPRALYKADFVKGMNIAINEVSHKKTNKVKNFNDFVSLENYF